MMLCMGKTKRPNVLEASLLGEGTVLRFDRDAWSMIK